MKRLIILALLVAAGWYGWKHYDELMHPQPHHMAVIRNGTGEKLVRIRLTVGGHTYVKEELANGESVTFPFLVDSDSPFQLVWEYESQPAESRWTGGLVAKGPLVARHTMTIHSGGGVVLESQRL